MKKKIYIKFKETENILEFVLTDAGYMLNSKYCLVPLECIKRDAYDIVNIKVVNRK